MSPLRLFITEGRLVGPMAPRIHSPLPWDADLENGLLPSAFQSDLVLGAQRRSIEGGRRGVYILHPAPPTAVSSY